MTESIDAGREDRHAHPWLAELIFALDSVLRHRHHVVEFSTDPACIFRLDISHAEQAFALADETPIRRGDRIVNLHLWNEQIPPVPSAGPIFSWARTFCRRLELSICELARYVEDRPELNDIVAVGANVAQGTREQRAQLTNIMRRFGFAPLPEGGSIHAEPALRRFGENILISVMVLAQNPVALRVDSLWRDRTPLFVSRSALLNRYGRRPRVSRSRDDPCTTH
jgi:hypothetical protein